MPIDIACKSCGRAYRLASEHAGKRFACKVCGKSIAVPIMQPIMQPLNAVRSSAPPSRISAPPAARQLPVDEGLPLRPDETTASNPGRAAIDYFQYFLCYPTTLVLFTMIFLVGLTGSILSGQWFVLPACLLGAAFKGRRFLRPLIYNARRLRCGNVNPAIVLRKSGPFSWRVAVFADLRTTGTTVKPSIYIGDFPLSRMGGGPPTVGMRLAAPSLYQGPPTAGAWIGFNPMIANCAVRNPLTLNRLLLSLEQDDWDLLDQYLPTVDSEKTGIYRLWPGGKNIPIRGRSLIVTIGFWFAVGVVAIGIATALILGPKNRNNEPSANAPTRSTPHVSPP